MQTIIVILVIAIICVSAALAYYLYKNRPTTSDSTNRMFMEYIGALREKYQNIVSKHNYKIEFEDVMYDIDNNFKSVLGDTYNMNITDKDVSDIKYCMNMLNKLDSVGFDIEIEENVSRESLVSNTYVKVKNIISGKVKNIKIAKPLCVLLTIEILLAK